MRETKMNFEVIKEMQMGQGETNYRVIGQFKTIKMAERKITQAKILYSSKNVTFRIDKV